MNPSTPRPLNAMAQRWLVLAGLAATAIIALFAASSGPAAATGTAAAQEASISVSITPASGPCGTVVEVTGTGGDPAVAAVDGGSAHTCAVTTAQVVKCWGWNSHGQLGDGTTTDNATAADKDFDRDGCQDEAELGSDATAGGLRNPKYYWDFYDTPDGSNVRDQVVTIADLNRVAARFGAHDNGGADPINRFTDPLTAPPVAPAYHPAFDRGSVIGPNPWDRAPADGTINLVDDILGVSPQFGHNCS